MTITAESWTEVPIPAAVQGTDLTNLVTAGQASLIGDNLVQAGGSLTLASTVTTPITAPTASKVSGVTAQGFSGTYYVSYSWYDGANETQVFAPSQKVAGLGTTDYIQITVPPAPAGVTQARVYMDTSTFGVGGGHLVSGATFYVSNTQTSTFPILSSDLGGTGSKSDNSFLTAGFDAAVMEPQQSIFTSTTGAIPSVEGGWLLAGDGRIRFVGPTINAQSWLYDDFFLPSAAYPATGAAGAFPPYWATTVSGASAYVTQGTSSSSDPGVIAIGVGTGTTNWADVHTGGAFAIGVGRFRVTWYMAFPAVPTTTHKWQCFIGLNDSTAASITTSGMTGTANCIGLQLNTSSGVSGSYALQAVFCNGSTRTITGATGPAITAGTFYLVEFELNAGLDQFTWWFNGTQVDQFNTDMTSLLPVLDYTMSSRIQIAKLAGNSDRALSLDAHSIYIDYVSG